MKKREFEATVISNRKVAEGFYKMELACRGLNFLPGQFFQLAVPGHTLRRPFAASASTPEGFTFVYQIVGSGTEDLTRLRKGAITSVLAPLGNGYALPRTKKTAAILVGGGCGTPSLALLAVALRKRGNPVYTVIGARTACSLLEARTFLALSDELTLATDDGSKGFHGNAVEAVMDVVLPKAGRQVALFACGPKPMLRGLAALADDLDIPCQVSLEERMACGFGACMGCAVKVRADNPEGYVFQRVCQEGPVFDAQQLLW